MKRVVPAVLLLAFLGMPTRPASAQATTAAETTAESAQVLIPSAPVAAEPARPFSSLFTGAARDLTRLPRKKPLIVLATGAQIAILTIAVDHSIRRHVPTANGLDEAMDAGAVLGNGATQGGAALATYVLGRLLGKPNVTDLGADLVEAQLVSGMLTQVIKITAARARPRGTAHTSFPSGHTSASFATAAVLQDRFGWRIGIPAYAAAAYVGLSRVSEDQHYFSDVIFGAAVGIAAARTVAIGRHARLQVAPYIARGGGAITFAVLPSTR